jgi:mono/diheme cytochrome c family protein
MRPSFKIFASVAGIIVLMVGAILGAAQFQFSEMTNQKFEIPQVNLDQIFEHADVAVGERIATVRNGCNDCHGRDFSGTTFASDPMIGTFTAANITPAGISRLTDGELAAILRYGIKPDGTSVIFMPSHETQELSASDIGSLIKYLRSIPPVAIEREPSKPGPLAKVLFMFGKLPQLFPALLTDKSSNFKSKPQESATVEFGAYLVQSACVGCHSPSLEGGPIKGAPPDWPAASNIKWAGQDSITLEKFISLIETGVSPTTGQAVKPPMPIGALKAMTSIEREAIFKYLKSI